MGRLSNTYCSSAEPAWLLRLLFPSANSGSFFVMAKVLPLQPTFPPLSSRATKNIFDRSTTPRQPPISHPHPPAPTPTPYPPEPASQFFRIRQTANCALCIASLWQALKALTNDSLIRRKAGGVEGETGWGERGERKKKQVARAVRRIGSGSPPEHGEGCLRGGRENNPSRHACCKTVQEEGKIRRRRKRRKH